MLTRLLRKYLPISSILRWSSTYVLGIETSCDDTGVALMTLDGRLVEEKTASQNTITTILGGVLPTVARELHAANIDLLTNSVLSNAHVSWKDINCIAVTVKPGMPLSLVVGVSFAKQMAQLYGKPVIPIHHMEAHALMAMFTHPHLQFPYLVVLLSGGHALIALVCGLEKFLLLGATLDSAPGSVLDKLARRLKLARLNDPRFRNVCGGRAIELCSSLTTGLSKYVNDFPFPRFNDRDCDFSFSGLLLPAERLIDQLEAEAVANGKHTADVLPFDQLTSVCSAIQYAMTLQVCRRLQRAFEFLALNQASDMFAWPTALVLSGGVAANSFLRAGLSRVASLYQLPLIAPPARLCTDNGVMIAWNGLLLRREDSRILQNSSSLDFESVAPFGIDCRALVRDSNIKIQPIRLTDLSLEPEPVA